MQPQQSIQSNQANTLVIEAWIHPHALTPSLIVHNLEMQGIQIQSCYKGMTITIDRGHYDCAGTNYAVIGVRTTSPIRYNPRPPSNPQSFYCSFFSQKATRDMDTNALHPHWLGNCCGFIGADFETHVSQCSHRHESGHAKTWRKANKDEVSEGEGELSEGEAQDQEDAVSVDPFPPANTNPNPNPNPKPKSLNPKDNLRIIQLQKKNFLLRTELDALKANLEAMKADICTIKTQFGSITNLVNEQEGWIKRANQCMQDWTNKGVIDRVWILETQHAYLRSEHLKHKEQQQQQQQQQRLQSQQQPQHPQQPQQQPQPNKCCKSLRKKLKKQHARHETVCSEMLERLTRLEANEANRNVVVNESCNKCNDDDIKCNKWNDDENKENYNPFAFSAIYDHYDQSHYLNNTFNDDECPALDLIVNHYATVDVPVAVVASNPDNDSDDDAYDDDMFELIQIDLPLPK